MKLPMLALVAALALAPLVAPLPALAQHEHGEHAAHAPAPVLAEGERWATDAPLREAMLRLRGEVLARLPAFHAGTLDAADAGALATAVEADVGFMVRNCKLEPEPDAALHGLIARMLAAATVLRTDPASGKGMPELVSVLDAYSSEFDHPGWPPLPAH